MALVRIPEGSYGSVLPALPGDRIVLLDDIQDPGNVGTLVRCAAAFDCSGLLLSAKCADPFGPKAVQASAGALMRPWIRRTDAYLAMVSELKEQGYRLLCADTEGRERMNFAGIGPVIIAFGNEGAGPSADLLRHADDCFTIPMNCSAVESLNVAVSGAIALFTAYSGQGGGRA